MKKTILSLAILAALSGAAFANKRDAGSNVPDTGSAVTVPTSDVKALAVPSSGKKVPLVLDKAKYKGGETAKLLVQSPFAKAVIMSVSPSAALCLAMAAASSRSAPANSIESAKPATASRPSEPALPARSCSATRGAR